ncbi:MAG TPA: metallophosphoesterase, partial [Candidatus Synoicihabitans sp.]|nr:metallophosphoesterase [Candidatus Synoicihabitans sp.]
MNSRIIAVGDIHGCHDEFAELLARLALTADDQLILLGDLINRGPNSAGVVALARTHRALSLLGNHELRLLNFQRTGDRSALKETDEETISQLSPEDWAYLRGMVLTHHLPEYNT